MHGTIDCLNCGRGHNEIKIDAGDPISLENGKRIVEDMLRRGYALFVHGDTEQTPPIRVEKFDANKGVYIIGAGPLYAGDSPGVKVEPEAHISTPSEVKHRGRKPKTTREVPIETAHVTAVARSAGG